MTSCQWIGPATRLDRVLPELGLARSRSQANAFISEGKVYVNGLLVTKAGIRVAPESEVAVTATDHYVSRAAHKLIVGLDAFGVDPRGVLALDVGASTGGFTQVLLERGAREVLAIDVGHGQLAELLREDSRVHLVEGFNARDLSPEALEARTGISESPALIVADLSFISLQLVLEPMLSVAAPAADFVLLIKPQFEVGRQGIVGGIVTNYELAVAAAARVISFAAGIGLECRGVEASPVTGEYGNRELLVHFVRGSGANQREWEERIRELFNSGGQV